MARYPVKALVLVVIMPFYARPGTFVTPDTADVGRIFLEAREALGDRDVLLGCARPAGMHKRVVDAYAVMAGLDGIAFPAEGALGVAALTGRRWHQEHACCSIKVGGKLPGLTPGCGARRMTVVDVLVVGLGPAGASAAAAAARAGARVLAVDRRPQPGLPVQCAEFVPSLLGVETGAVKAAALQEITAMATFLGPGGPEHTPDFRGVMIDRSAFDAALLADAKKAGAAILTATAFHGVDGRQHPFGQRHPD